MDEILSHPFSYMAKGKQSYVFLSEDKKMVLKLFRFDACRVPFGQIFVRNMRKWLGMRPKHFLPLEVEIEKNFTSCKLAYTLAAKQTGLIFVHLNPKECGLPLLTLRDRLGRSHKIDPAKYRFIIQKKIEPFLDTFARNQLDTCIASYTTLLNELAEAGLVNLDPKIGRNFGFLEGRAVQIDVGNFVYDPDRARKAPAAFMAQLNRWIYTNNFKNRESAKEAP